MANRLVAAAAVAVATSRPVVGWPLAAGGSLTALTSLLVVARLRLPWPLVTIASSSNRLVLASNQILEICPVAAGHHAADVVTAR